MVSGAEKSGMLAGRSMIWMIQSRSPPSVDAKIDNWMSVIRPEPPFFDENISAHGIKADRLLTPESYDW
jgi:hypothetical protein